MCWPLEAYESLNTQDRAVAETGHLLCGHDGHLPRITWRTSLCIERLLKIFSGQKFRHRVWSVRVRVRVSARGVGSGVSSLVCSQLLIMSSLFGLNTMPLNGTHWQFEHRFGLLSYAHVSAECFSSRTEAKMMNLMDSRGDCAVRGITS